MPLLAGGWQLTRRHLPHFLQHQVLHPPLALATRLLLAQIRWNGSPLLQTLRLLPLQPQPRGGCGVVGGQRQDQVCVELTRRVHHGLWPGGLAQDRGSCASHLGRRVGGETGCCSVFVELTGRVHHGVWLSGLAQDRGSCDRANIKSGRERVGLMECSGTPGVCRACHDGLWPGHLLLTGQGASGWDRSGRVS